MPKKKKQKRVDWEAVEPEYRANQFSLRELGRKYKCSAEAIRKHAKKHKWKRDLTAKIKAAVDRKLVDAAVDGFQVKKRKEEENQIVEAAAQKAVDVITLQRRDLRELRQLEKDLIRRIVNDEAQLVYKFSNTGEFFSEQVRQGILDRARTLKELSVIRHKRISLERLAWNIEGKLPGDEPASGIAGQIHREIEWRIKDYLAKNDSE